MARVGDRVRLNYFLQEFDIQKYIDGEQLYSFKNIQLNIPDPDHEMPIRNSEFLPSWVPILMTNYEEDLLEVRFENNRDIGYTKSFKIDLTNAIKEHEIIINALPKDEQAGGNYQVFVDFIQNILDVNANFASGLITKLERKWSIQDSFQTFYESIFKEELQRIREQEIFLSDQEFFSNSWKRYLPRTDSGVTKTVIKNIVFIWTIPPTKFAWYHQFVQEIIKKGLDRKTIAKLGFSGISVSNERPGKTIKNRVWFTIDSENRKSTDRLHYKLSYVNKKQERREIETENIWDNKEFQEILDRIDPAV